MTATEQELLMRQEQPQRYIDVLLERLAEAERERDEWHQHLGFIEAIRRVRAIEAEQRVEGIKAQRDALIDTYNAAEQWHQHSNATWDSLSARAIEAEQRAEAVVSWLRENAVHADHCLMYDTWNSDAPECNCGYDAVLRGTPALTAPRPAADGTAHENQREES